MSTFSISWVLSTASHGHRLWPLLLALAATSGIAAGSKSKKTSIWTRFRHTLFGKPISSKFAHEEKLGVFLGLPVFSSDALSSVAYATEAILGVLILAGLAQLGLTWPITLGICGLIAIVAFSYRQTIDAYPSGGGSYIVASENLGKFPGLVAGGALLIDYVLTVSVSVAAGVAAITSAYPALHPYLTEISTGCILVVAWANLRGTKESGALFALPTYGFLIAILIMLVKALSMSFGSSVDTHIVAETGVIGSELSVPLIFVVLRSFAAGCTALTGIEAVSNGVPAFKEPASRNASRTLVLMASLLVVLFLGIGYAALHMPTLTMYSTKNPEYRTLVSQIAAFSFGNRSMMFYIIQFATAAILILAANTSFADFPRLARLMAKDGFLPRQLLRQGDRLVFQNGIILLAISASILIWHFHGELDLLLPLYAVGVFTAFTLSQFGMVRHWLKLRDRSWVPKLVVNGIGAAITLVVALIILGTKFREGAWIVVVLIIILISLFLAISRRYKDMARQLAADEAPTAKRRHTILLLIPRIHRGTLLALDYANQLGGDARAIHVTFDDPPTELMKTWNKLDIQMPLVVLNSPYRSLTGPVLDYVDQMIMEDPERLITVIVAEAYSLKPWHRLLHESVAFQLRVALGLRRNVIVSSVRYFLS